MIISLHLPKTAGTSFGAALQRHFGDGLRRDYDDLPLNTPVAERQAAALRACLAQADAPAATCVHGHFLPVKYLLGAQHAGARFVSWMRHPVDRLLSHYFFWRKHAPPSPRHAVHHRMHAEDWSLERFCLAPELRDVYTQFLWAFPLEYFEFIGITEHYEDDFAHFSRTYLDGAVAPPRLNVGERGKDGAYRIDPALRARIEEFHARDMALYQRALQLREARLATAPRERPADRMPATAWPSLA